MPSLSVSPTPSGTPSNFTPHWLTHAAMFRVLFEQAPVGMAYMTIDGYWQQSNEKLCEILGYSAAELQTKTFAEITHPADHKQDEKYYNLLCDGDIENCAFEKRYLHALGRSVWTHVSVSALRQENGELDGFIVTVEDVSQRKQEEALTEQRNQELRSLNRRLAHTARALERRNTELQQFAYVVSHDLKAPLRAISSLSEWLEEDLEGSLPEDSQKHLQLIRKRINRMGSLLDGLLDYSRVGRKQMDPEEVSVRTLLGEVIDSVGAADDHDPDARPDYSIEIIGEMPTLHTRRLSLFQVFSNLISNSVKYGDRPDLKVEITAREEGDRYVFSVRDNGPGIDPQHHDKIFGIFQTLQPRDRVESTGVGLAIVHKILDTEGGSIWLDSSVDEGATFNFSWPKQPLEE